MRWDFLMVWIDALSRSFSTSGNRPTLTGCLNCRKGLDKETKYCPKCGQKARESTLTVWVLLEELFDNIFNIDNSFYRSIYRLFYPGYLAKAYVEGKRKSYLNPIRFFLVSLVIFITLLSFEIDLNPITVERESNIREIGQAQLYDDFIAWKDSIDSDASQSALIDSMESQLFKNVKSAIHDSMSVDIGISSKDLSAKKYLKSDFFLMDINEFLDKYEIQGFWNRLRVSQVVKLTRNIDGAIGFFIGNLLWGVLCAIVLMGFVLKLIYIRRNRYYVEHLIFLFTIHTAIFALGTIAIGLKYILGQDDSYDGILYLSIPAIIYIPWSMKVFYEQGIIKTLLKSTIAFISYIGIFILAILLVLMISFLLFN